jgi:hypothetical protein
LKFREHFSLTDLSERSLNTILEEMVRKKMERGTEEGEMRMRMEVGRREREGGSWRWWEVRKERKKEVERECMIMMYFFTWSDCVSD